MDTATIQWIISLFLCIIPWFFPNSTWYWKIIITLGIALVSLFISWIRLSRKLEESQKALQDLDGRHKALAAQFDQKNIILQKFQHLATTMEQLLHIALLNEDKAKIHLIYQAYLETKRELIDGGNSDDQQL